MFESHSPFATHLGMHAHTTQIHTYMHAYTHTMSDQWDSESFPVSDLAIAERETHPEDDD